MGDGTLLPELGFTAGELVSSATRGRYLLVGGAYPRLYDLGARRASDTARAVTLWPCYSGCSANQ